jgi:hypothetical protein
MGLARRSWAAPAGTAWPRPRAPRRPRLAGQVGDGARHLQRAVHSARAPTSPGAARRLAAGRLRRGSSRVQPRLRIRAWQAAPGWRSPGAPAAFRGRRAARAPPRRWTRRRQGQQLVGRQRPAPPPAGRCGPAAAPTAGPGSAPPARACSGRPAGPAAPQPAAGAGVHRGHQLEARRKLAPAAPRAMVMWPVSSGSRSASSAARGNSGSSSRNSTPPCASEISPGRGGEPPPTRPRRWPSGAARAPAAGPSARGRSRPARLAGGALPAPRPRHGRQQAGRRCASIDLPVPGGPTISSCGRRPRRSPARAWRGLAAHVGAGRGSTRQRGRGGRGRRRQRLLPPPSPACNARARTTSSRWARGTRARPGTSAASAALPGAAPAARTPSAQRQRQRQRAAHRAQFARPATARRQIRQAASRGVDLAAGRQDAQRDRQVEAARILGQVGRRQVDGDALVVRELQ